MYKVLGVPVTLIDQGSLSGSSVAVVYFVILDNASTGALSTFARMPSQASASALASTLNAGS